MYEGHTIGVVVPAYNEEGFVGRVLEVIPGFVDRIYAVDDHSTDGTWAEITRVARKQNAPEHRRSIPDGGELDAAPIVPIRHEENRGAGGAIKTGYLHAADDEIDVTVTMDADGQMDPDLLTRIIDPIVRGDADYAKGNRLGDPQTRADMPRFRLVGNWLLTGLTKIASGYWGIADPQNGYTAISHDALEAIDIQSMYEYYGYCNDLLVKLNVAGMRVVDVEMPATYGDEQSSITYSEYIPNVSGMLLRNFLWRLKVRYLSRTFHPIALLYTVGALSGSLALVATVGRTADSQNGEASKKRDRRVRVAGLLTLLVGSHCFLVIAMILDRSENRELEVTGK